MDINNNETYEQKKRRLSGKINFMSEYLQILNRILKMKITTNQLLSIVETDNFLSSNKKWNKVYKKTIPFEQKNELRRIIHSTIQNESIPYLVYLNQSLLCGLCIIPNLYVFNWNFKFNDEPYGLIIFIRKDGKEKIVLDFYEEDLEYFLDIIIYHP